MKEDCLHSFVFPRLHFNLKNSLVKILLAVIILRREKVYVVERLMRIHIDLTFNIFIFTQLVKIPGESKFIYLALETKSTNYLTDLVFVTSALHLRTKLFILLFHGMTCFHNTKSRDLRLPCILN